MLLLASVLSLFALALLAPTLHRALGKLAPPLMALVPAGWFAYFASFVGSEPGTLEEYTRPWVSQLDLTLALRLDGLSLLMALLITGIGSCVILYAGTYLRGHRHHSRFYGYLLAFMASMLGVVLADDLIALFIFWELTSITSYLLIGFDHQKEESRRSALQALLVTGLGGLSLLAGLIMLGLDSGHWRLSELIAHSQHVRDGALYTPAVLCILAGCFTKSAIFPFHFWLPGAMAAPTPVSAYLHSSTMVKAGVFLLARLQPALGDTPLWQWALIGLGGLTMVMAIYLATRQTYFKKLLAYSTVSSLATMVMLIGMGEAGAHAAMAYLFCHALFKGALFLLAGIADHETGVKDVEKLGGLWRLMPISAGASFLAAISMAGAPPMVGFAAKELMIKASMDAPIIPGIVTAATVLSGALMVMVALTVGWRPYGGKPAWDEQTNPRPKTPHEAPPSLLLGPVLLGALGFTAAFLPSLYADPIVDGAKAALLPVAAHAEHAEPHAMIDRGVAVLPAAATGDGKSHDYSMGIMGYLTHPGLALALSALAIVGGLALYPFRAGYRRATEPLARALTPIGPQAGYTYILKSVTGFASLQTKALQNGSLSSYVRTILIATMGLGIYGLARSGRSPLDLPEEAIDIGFYEGTLALLTIISAVGATIMRSRLSAVLCMGIAGYCVATLFVIYGAPDVAMTQFAIETLTAIILILVVWHLPRFITYSSRLKRFYDAAVALAFGAVMSAFVIVAADVQTNDPISGYFNKNSYTEAKGQNIVNVILVDFRGTDTLGEIAVLGIAAIGVYTLIKLRSQRADTVPVAPPFFERRNEGEFL